MKKILPSLFVALLFILYWILPNGFNFGFSGDKIISESSKEINTPKKLVKPQGLTKEKAESIDTTKKSLNEADTRQVTTQKCYTFDEFVDTGIGENVQNWFASFGVPRSNTLTLEQEVHPYSNYEESALERMIESNDPDAAYVLGMNLVSQALTGEKISPQISGAVNDNLPLNYLPQIDKEKLKQGREILFESAVYGNIYAFVELALSYSSELKALELAGVILSEQQKRDFTLEINKFGSIPNILIPELDKNFFQGPDIGNSKEMENILKWKIKKTISQFSEIRKTKGFPPYKAESRSDYFEPFEICPSN
jgi:hypothetical protein